MRSGTGGSPTRPVPGPLRLMCARGSGGAGPVRAAFRLSWGANQTGRRARSDHLFVHVIIFVPPSHRSNRATLA